MAAALFAVAIITGAPRPAEAAADYLDVAITSLSTPTLDLSNPDQVLTLSGTITNVSTVSIRYANVHFWRSPAPLTDATSLSAALAAPPIGERLNESEDNYFTISQDDAFGPGERVDFSVSGTVEQLTGSGTPIRTDDAAYLVGVQVRGLPDDAMARGVIGREVVAMAATTSPVDSSSVVMLTAEPSWAADGTFLNDSLEAELDGRLDALLTSAERADVVAALDPALYQAVEALSVAHVVDGEQQPGSGIALRWVSRVKELIADGSVWRLPFGNPDLVRAAASDSLDEVLQAASDALPRELLDLPTVAVLDSGATAALLDDLGNVDTVIVRGAEGSQTGSPDIIAATVPAQSATTPALRAATQIAEELVAQRPPLYLISTAEQAKLDAAGGQLRTQTRPTSQPQSPLVWPAGFEVDAWPGVEVGLREARDSAALYRDLTGHSAEDISGLIATAFSSDFTAQADAVAWLEAASTEQVDAKAVTLRAASSFVMSSRTNNFPATLTNKLDVPITVKVAFTSDSPQRINVPDLDEVHVGPGEALTLNVSPEATSNGVSLVHAQVTTVEGAPLGKPVTIEITATELGRVGWIIILVSGAVVLGGTAWRIRTVRHERAKEEAEVAGQ